MAATSDVIRANHDPKFYYRFIFMAIAAFGFALYCLYDGFIGYPAQRERALKFEEFNEENRLSEWAPYARAKGWAEEAPGEPKSEADILMQFIMAGMCGAAALALLFVVWRARGRWIEADDTGIRSSWGQSLTYDQVTALDKRHWRKKGIAKIRYKDGGRRRTFVLDDYKFERDATDAILFDLEGRIGYDKIVNGPPEPVEVDYDEAESAEGQAGDPPVEDLSAEEQSDARR